MLQLIDVIVSPALFIGAAGNSAKVGSGSHSLDDGVFILTLDVQNDFLCDLIHAHQLTCSKIYVKKLKLFWMSACFTQT